MDKDSFFQRFSASSMMKELKRGAIQKMQNRNKKELENGSNDGQPTEGHTDLYRGDGCKIL